MFKFYSLLQVSIHMSLKLQRVNESRILPSIFIDDVLITFSKFTKQQKFPYTPIRPCNNSLAVSFLLHLLRFVIFPKQQPEHSSGGGTAFSRSFLALTIWALRRRCALTHQTPNPQRTSPSEPRNSFHQDLSTTMTHTPN